VAYPTYFDLRKVNNSHLIARKKEKVYEIKEVEKTLHLYPQSLAIFQEV
jgi:hypothetical protein